MTELSAVTNDEFDQLPKDRIREQLRTARELATSLNGLPVLPSISRQGTTAPLEQNPRFQQLQQRVQNLTNERETLAEERDALTKEPEALLTKGQGQEASYRAIETDLGRDRATIVTLNTALTNTNTALATATTGLANTGDRLHEQANDPPSENQSPRHRSSTDPKTKSPRSLRNSVRSSSEMPTHLWMSNIGRHMLLGS